jgi:hypothetical protein
MKLTPYQTYCLYLAIKSHFTQPKYDFFRYAGAVKAKQDSFEKRRDKYHFVRLSKKYDETEMRDFLVANFICEIKWVGSLLEDAAHYNYIMYLKRKQAFTYHFSNELTALLSNVDDPRDLFICTTTTYPKIIHEYLAGTISLETLSVLNRFICFFDKLDKHLDEDDIIWSSIRQKAIKLHSFLEYDGKRIKDVLKKHLNR